MTMGTIALARGRFTEMLIGTRGEISVYVPIPPNAATMQLIAGRILPYRVLGFTHTVELS
jgi:hypothetical protein